MSCNGHVLIDIVNRAHGIGAEINPAPPEVTGTPHQSCLKGLQRIRLNTLSRSMN